MIVELEVTFEQLRDAYLEGQRTFRNIKIVAEDGHPLISGINLSMTEFVNCWLHSVKFADVDFTGARFHECNLKCTAFERCTLNDTIWKDSSVCSIVWRDCATENLRADGLEAYGGHIDDRESFVSYTTDKRNTG